MELVWAEFGGGDTIQMLHGQAARQGPVAVNESGKESSGGDFVARVGVKNGSEMLNAGGAIMKAKFFLGTLKFEPTDGLGQARISLKQLTIGRIGFGALEGFRIASGSDAPS